MEVIAATSAITSLFSFGLQVAGGLFELYNTIKNAPVDLKDIQQDIRALCGVLAHLQEQLGEHSIPGSKKRFSANLRVLAPALDHCQTLFSELQGKVEAAHGLLRNEETGSSGEKLKPSLFLKDRFRPIWERAKWPFTKDDLVKIRSRPEDAKSTLNLCLVIILATPQLNDKGDRIMMLVNRSDVGKNNELERQEATASVIAAFRSQQKAKQRIAAVEHMWPSQGNASIASQISPSQPASSLDTISRNPSDDQRPRDIIGGNDNNDIQPVKTESSIAAERNDNPYNELKAWISGASQSGRANSYLAPVAMRVRLAQSEVRAILRDSSIPLMQALNQLNHEQRHWVISHVNELGDNLLHVSSLPTTPMDTVFGNINITSLFWITEYASEVLSSKTETEASNVTFDSGVIKGRSRPRFLGRVRTRFGSLSQLRQGGSHRRRETVITEDKPVYSEPTFTAEYGYAIEPTEQQIKALAEKLEREKLRSKLEQAQYSRRRKLPNAAVYSETEAEIGEDDEDKVPGDKEKLVEQLVAEWINVYDEPSQPD